MSNCEQCNDKGWVKSWGRLGDEIQVCQDCFKFFLMNRLTEKQAKKLMYQNTNLINMSFMTK